MRSKRHRNKALLISRAVQAVAEPLEPRRLLASISGVVFNDRDGNGLQDAVDQPLSGRTVFLDANDNGTLDAGELSRLTPANGSYSFNSLPAGSYVLRQILPSQWQETTPAGALRFTVTAPQVVTGANFGSRFITVNGAGAFIRGTIYNDRDADGVIDSGEPALAGRTVFIDGDDDGVFDSGELTAVSDSAGFYEFSNLIPGNHVVRTMLPSGWTHTATNGVSTEKRVTVAAGQTLQGQNFGSAIVSITYREKILPTGVTSSTLFGMWTSSDGATAASLASTPDGIVVFVYERQGDGSLLRTATLTTPLSIGEDYGRTVAVEGGRIVVGGTRYDAPELASDVPFVYVFDRLPNGTWTDANPIGLGVNFAEQGLSRATAVLLRGDRLFVSTNENEDKFGAVYVFDYAGNGQWNQQDEKIVPFDRAAGDYFGFGQISASADGTRLAIGALGDDEPGASATGSVYIFELVGSTWIQRSKLTTGDRSVDQFLCDPVLVGDLLFAGAHGDAGGNGAVYVFRRGPSGVWLQTAKITAPDGVTSGSFGRSLTYANDTLFVGAPNAGGTGAVYAMQLTGQGEIWTPTRKLTPSDPGTGDRYGNFVAVDQRRLYVSNYTDDNDIGTDAGSLYIYDVALLGYLTGTAFSDPNRNGIRDGGEGVIAGRTVYLDADDDGVLDGGESSSVTNASGNYFFNDLVPGSYVVRLVQVDETSQTLPGSGDGWRVTLAPGQTFVGDFGIVPQATVVSGLVWNDRNADGVRDAVEPVLSGLTVYWDANNNGVLDGGEKTAVSAADGTWTIRNVLPGNRVFRQVVPPGSKAVWPAVGGSTLVPAGVTTTTINFGSRLMVPTPTQKVDPSIVAAYGNFGFTRVAIDGTTAITTASGGFLSFPGYAYVYDISNGTWVESARLTVPSGFGESFFGWDVAVAGDFAFVSDSNVDSGGGFRGAVYVFKRQVDSQWQFVQRLLPDDGAGGTFFGASLVAQGDTLVVGGDLAGLGRIYVFQRQPNDSWTQVFKYVGLLNEGLGTDRNIDIDGDIIVAGAGARNSDAGGVYVFTRSPLGVWGFSQLISPPSAGSMSFGKGVSIDDGVMVIGATNESTRQSGEGAAFVYELSGPNTWNLRGTLRPAVIANWSYGASVDVSGSRIAVSTSAFVDVFWRSSSAIWERSYQVPRFDPNEGISAALALYGDDALVVGAYDSTPVANAGALFVLAERSAGYLTGAAFSDTNRNGVRDGGEAVIAGRTVYLDTDDDGVLDGGESSSVTNASGNYFFNDLVPGSYVVRLVQVDETSQTLPALGDGVRVTLQPGQTFIGDFGIVNSATVVTGVVWNDRNADGVRDSVEPVLSGRNVYWDANNNGVLDVGERSGVSASDGSWSVRNVLPGNRVFRQLLPTAAWTASTPAGAVTAQVVPVTGANIQLGSFSDAILARNQFTVGSAPSVGIGFPASIAISGGWAVVGAENDDQSVPLVAEGAAYILRRSADGTWLQTQRLKPSAIDYQDFGKSVAVDGNTLAVFGVPGSNFSSRPQVFIYGLDSNQTWSQRATLTPPAGYQAMGTSPESISIAGDTLLVGAMPTGFGARAAVLVYKRTPGTDNWILVHAISTPEPGNPLGGDFGAKIELIGTTAYIGAPRSDHAGFDSGAIYVYDEQPNGTWTQTQRITDSAAAPSASFGLGFHVDGHRMVVNTQAVQGIPLFQRDPQTLRWQQRPNIAQPATSALWGAGGLAIAGDTIVVSGRVATSGGPGPINAGELHVLRDDGSGNWRTVQRFSRPGVAASEWFGGVLAFDGSTLIAGPRGSTYPPTPFAVWDIAPRGYLVGSVYQDQNNNGVRNAGDAVLPSWSIYLDNNDNGVLDAGDTSTTTDSSGSYFFNDLIPGNYVIRQQPQARWQQTMPTSDQPWRVAVSPGQTVVQDFGMYATATVTGRVFSDANGNGTRDGADANLAGWLVFGDLNNNRLLDVGERTTVTAADGTYVLDFLPVQTVRVDVLGGAAWLGTSRTVALSQLLVQTGIDLGSQQAAVAPPVGGTQRVSGRLAIDEDGNNMVDGYELDPVPNAQLRIWRDDADGLFEPGLGDTLVTTLVTDATGAYTADVGTAGSYWVEVITTSAGMEGRSLYGRDSVVRTATGAQQLNGRVDFSVLSAYVVSITNDEFDNNFSQSDLSLREAVFQARLRGAGLILFSTGLYNQTLTLSPGRGQLSLSSSVTILGPAGGTVVIRSASNSRLFYVESGLSVEMRNLTLSGGNATTGGAVFVSDGASMLGTDLEITGNTASQRGGGIYVSAGGSLTLQDTLIRGNTATSQGGGLYADAESLVTLERVTIASNHATGSSGEGGGVHSSGILTAKLVTISGNSATRRGGGVLVASAPPEVTVSTADMTGSTIARNTAASGAAGIVVSEGAVAVMSNTIVAENRLTSGVAADVGGTILPTSSHNLIGSGAVGLAFGVNGNLTGSPASPLSPRLLPLGDYGGLVPTHALAADSPGADSGSNLLASGLSTDAAGNPRLRDFDSNGSTVVDIGAYEAAPLLLVNSVLDESVDSDGLLSLREAFIAADSSSGLDIIRASQSLSFGGAITLPLSLGEIVVAGPVLTDGSGGRVTLTGSGTSRLFSVSATGWLSLSDLTVSGGSAVGDGGAVLSAGRLDAERVLFVSNSASGSGGAIASSGTLSLVNVTFGHNQANVTGGAVAVTAGTAVVLNSTVSANRAGVSGGGVAGLGGSVTLSNTIVAGNEAGSVGATLPGDATGSFSGTSSYNFFGTTAGSTGLSSGVGSTQGNPLLTTLSHTGGSHATFGVLAGSPVVDAGSDALAAGLSTDARGEPRFRDGDDDTVARVDIGAFEQQIPLNQAPTLSSLRDISGVVEGVAFSLRHDLLLDASDAADPDNLRSSLGFKVDSVLAGTLTYNGQPVVPGQTSVLPGQLLTWTPPAGLAFGTDGTALVDAVRLRAFDGQVASLAAVTLRLRVTTVASPVNYAVLYSGGDTRELNHSIYYSNLKRTFEVLVRQYGLLPENIAVIYADGRDPAFDQPGNISSDMSFAPNVLPATRANLRNTLVGMSSLVDANDHLFFWAFDHGLGTPAQPTTLGEEVLRGWGESETIRDDDLRVWLHGLSAEDSAAQYGVPSGYPGVRPEFATYVFGQCFAGGTLDDLIPPGTAAGNRFGAAASNHYEASYGDFFISAFTDALAAGVNRTDEAFYYAYSRDSRARPGYFEGAYQPNQGPWQFNIEHPWSAGGSFPIFHVGRSSANATPTVRGVTPPKLPVGGSEIELTYDLLRAAVDAVEPTNQQLSYSITNVAQGTLWRNGVQLQATDLPVTIGQRDRVGWRPGPNPPEVSNALIFRVVAADGARSVADSVLRIRVGNPSSGVIAQGDAFTVRPDTMGVPLDVLGNDLGSGLELVRLGNPSAGSAWISQDGLLLYTPTPGFTGNDRLSYIVRDAAGNTDVATLSISVRREQATGVGLPAFRGVVLGVPDRWAEMPTSWSPSFRNTLPQWQSSFGLDLTDAGEALVAVQRPFASDPQDPTSYFTPFAGGSLASYRWSRDTLPPYWNWNASAGVVASNARMSVLVESGVSVPNYVPEPARSQLAGIPFAYGIEAASLGNPRLVPGRLYIPPGNATETSQPSRGTLLSNPGTPDEVAIPLLPQQAPVAISPGLTDGGTGTNTRYVSLINASVDGSEDPVNINPAAQIWYLGGASTGREFLRQLGGPAGDGRSGGEVLLADGDVLGTAESGPNMFSAFRYDFDTGQMTLLPSVAGGLRSTAVAANNSGVIIGTAAPLLRFRNASLDLRIDRGAMRQDGSRAIRWTGVNSTPVDLGTLATDRTSGWAVAYDINNDGVIVGSSNHSAFICVAGVMYDLNDLVRSGLPTYLDPITQLPVPKRLISADAINNSGQILATLDNRDGTTRAVFLDLASALELTPDTAQAFAKRPITLSPLANDRGASFLVSTTQPSSGKVSFNSATNIITFDPQGQFDDLLPGQAPREVSFSYTARDSLDATATATVTLSVAALGTFHVAELTGNSAGVSFRFSHPPASPNQLNLVSGPANSGRPADLTLVGPSGPVRGSLVADGSDTTFRFIPTGGTLSPGSYTLTLASRSSAFTNSSLGNLDGNADDTAGGDYLVTFYVAAPSGPSTIQLPPISRAPGQTLGLPSSPGYPINLTSPAGVRAVSFQLDFGPAQLNVTDVLRGPSLPADWITTIVPTQPGRYAIALVGATPLTGVTPVTLVRLLGSVPVTATSLTASPLRISELVIADRPKAPGVSSVLLTVAPGDATGNNVYSAEDVSLLSRIAVGLDSGFDALPAVDPVVLGDVNSDAAVTVFDASEVLAAALGHPAPLLPPLAGGGSSGLNLGPVPLSLQTSASGSAPTLVTVSASINVPPTAVPLRSLDLELTYPASAASLVPQSVVLGAALQAAGFAVSAADFPSAGRLRLTVTGSSALPTGLIPGAIALQLSWPGSSSQLPLTLTAAADEGDFGPTSASALVARPASAVSVVTRGVFYRNSSFATAIATDKSALLPGQSSTFAHYTSYPQGLTGLVLDIANLPAGFPLSGLDLRMGNTTTPASWPAAPAPASFTLSPGTGVGGSTRITLTFADNTVRNTWLSVRVRASASGLPVDDVFYFGNQVGETGDASGRNAFVDATDLARVRDNPRSFLNPAPITDRHDINRDARVDATDLALVRDNFAGLFSSLVMLTPPANVAVNPKPPPPPTMRNPFSNRPTPRPPSGLLPPPEDDIFGPPPQVLT
jgi:predicted outer membrane repeat protein